MRKGFLANSVWLLFILALTITACGPSNSAAQPNLGGDPWNLVSLVGNPVLPGSTVDLVFNPDGNLGGKAGCNNYFASFQVDGDELSIGQAGSTMMMCVEPEGVMQQEMEFLNVLPQVQQYGFADGKLQLMDGSGQVLMVFER